MGDCVSVYVKGANWVREKQSPSQATITEEENVFIICWCAPILGAEKVSKKMFNEYNGGQVKVWAASKGLHVAGQCTDAQTLCACHGRQCFRESDLIEQQGFGGGIGIPMLSKAFP